MKYLIFLFLLIQTSLLASESLHYYGKKFEDINNGNMNEHQIKSYLHHVLDSFHTPQENNFDLISSDCNLQLNNCYKHISNSYKKARIELMGRLHLENNSGDYYINTVYCNYFLGHEDFDNGPVPGVGIIPNSNKINTEHTWPQSKFSTKYPKTIQKSDLHALFPTNPRINTIRSNLNFGEVKHISTNTCPGTKVGFLNLIRPSRHFEPPDNHKGNVARALFYFSIRYNLPISFNQEHFIKKWHQLDPVDEFERWRHEEIYKFQKVRNPFIDHPWLVDLISNF